MPISIPDQDPYFNAFEADIDAYTLPDHLVLMDGSEPDPLCLIAAKELQEYISSQEAWDHNFGLSNSTTGTVIGKMFGVLVVKTEAGEIGYLAAFSGKLAGGNHHAKFVPPVFDLLTDNSFLNIGMQELARINQNIKTLQEEDESAHKHELDRLKIVRKEHSLALQNEIYDHYHFLNQAGVEKSLRELFKNAHYKNPPSGAGECAGPKLLQYAFQHQMKPLGIAEFWWGKSPKSDYWKHGHFYPCCKEKCAPILAHMLS